mgnify:FL=1
MAKITVHPGGFIKRNYIDELGLTAAELEQWTPTKQVKAEGLVAVKGGKSKAKRKVAAKSVAA